MGLQEMTRLGMGQAGVERVAESMKVIVINQKDFREEVHRVHSDPPAGKVRLR
jgi:glycine/serine hydroxymethyltransferase